MLLGEGPGCEDLWSCYQLALPGSGQHCHLPAPCPQHWLFPEARCASLQASAARPCSWGLLAHRRSPCSQKAPTVQGISTGGAAAGCPSRQGAGGFTADHVGRARWDPLPGILWRHFHFYMVCCAFLQGIFPVQGLNPDLRHCRWILYHLSHQGSPKQTKKGLFIPHITCCLRFM